VIKSSEIVAAKLELKLKSFYSIIIPDPKSLCLGDLFQLKQNLLFAVSHNYSYSFRST
jgi:hypothetical protein